MKSYLEMHGLIAAEYHIHLPDSTPLYEIQFMASLAENRRNERFKAAEAGKIFVG
jgi:hypothetical protein